MNNDALHKPGRRRLLCAALALLGLALAGPSFGEEATGSDASAGHFDVIIENGSVYDGSGAAPQSTDVGLVGDRIAFIGDLSGAKAERRVDATDLAVVPGFIDIHSHAVNQIRETSGLFNHPESENYLRQGVTAAIGGPDGRSWVPASKLLDEVEALPIGVNFGTFIGHNSIRASVMGRDDRAPTETELSAMVDVVDQAMRDGAFGLSAGPSNFALKPSG